MTALFRPAISRYSAPEEEDLPLPARRSVVPGTAAVSLLFVIVVVSMTAIPIPRTSVTRGTLAQGTPARFIADAAPNATAGSRVEVRVGNGPWLMATVMRNVATADGRPAVLLAFDPPRRGGAGTENATLRVTRGRAPLVSLRALLPSLNPEPAAPVR